MKNSPKTPIKFKQIFTSLLIILMLFSNVLSVKSNILAEDSLDVPEINETTDIDNNDINNNEQATDKEAVPEDTNKDDLDNDEITEELDKEEIDGENEDIEISFPTFDQETKIDDVLIRVTADENVFPNNSTLHVEKVSNSQQNQVDEAIEEVRNEELNVAVSYTFDIKVLDEEDNEIQPLDESKVAVSFTLVEAVNNNLEVQVYHVDDELNVVELDTEVNEDVVTVETDGFSFYTVEFTYNNLQYVLDGDEEIELSVILEALKLTGSVTNVEVSNSELFSYEDGIIYSHQPFDTEEWMKVTIDGIEFVIVVTDDNLPPFVTEGVDFEHDIIYKNHFDKPTISINATGEGSHKVEYTYRKYYTQFSHLITATPTYDSFEIVVDYGVVGTLNGLEVKQILTLSNFVVGSYADRPMEIYIGDDPRPGYSVHNVYLCKTKYDLSYADGTKLDNPVITFGSLNGVYEGVKPINSIKVSKDSSSIIERRIIRNRNTITQPSLDDSIKGDGWFYYKENSSMEDRADYIFNPLTGKIDKYNPKVAVSAFFTDSTDMQTYVTAVSGNTWQNAYVIAHEPTKDLTIKKETDIKTEDEFNFKLKIWREIETQKITVTEEEAPENEAYVVFDSQERTLTFFRDEPGTYTNGQTEGSKTYYTNFENIEIKTSTTGKPGDGSLRIYINETTPPWYNIKSQVTKVLFEDEIIPNSTDAWFENMRNLTEVEGIEHLKMHKVIAARRMFNNCSSLTKLDTSEFYMPSCRVYGTMFAGCTNLAYLNLKSLDFNEFYGASPYEVTGFSNMFDGCNNLRTELVIPCMPVNCVDVFKNAATKNGSKITFKTFAMSEAEVDKLISEAGSNSNIEFLGYVDELPNNLPYYLNNENIEHVKQYHIFDMRSDTRFAYDSTSQEYSFSLKSGQEIKIENIPKSYNYKVYEIDEDGNEVPINGSVDEDWILAYAENRKGTMDEDVTSTFTNHSKHNLKINKETNIETNDKFDFKLTVWKNKESKYKSIARYVFEDSVIEHDPHDPAQNPAEKTNLEFHSKGYPIKIGDYTFTKYSRYMRVPEHNLIEELGDYDVLWNDLHGYSAESLEFYPKEDNYTGETVTAEGKALYKLDWIIEYNGHTYDSVYTEISSNELFQAIASAFSKADHNSHIVCHFYVLDHEDYISDDNTYEVLSSGIIEPHYLDLTEKFGEMDEDKYYSLNLIGGQSVEVPEIPNGYSYEIYETNSKGEKVSKGKLVNEKWIFDSSENDSGTITNKDAEATFNNKARIPYEIEIEKIISGDKPSKPNNFEFCLEGKEDAPMPKGSENNKKYITITGEGNAKFGEIECIEVGTYEYDVYEVVGNETGYTYDDTKYHLVYEVTTGEGGFVVNRTVTADGEPYEDEALLFDNEYEKPVTPETDVAIRVRKTISGDIPENDSEFRFCLESINDAPMPAGSNNNRKYVSITGRGSTEFGSIKFTSPGTYEYDAYEIDGRVSGYTYDTTRYHITYKVTLVDKELVVERTVTANGKTYTGTALLFDNKHKKPSPSDDKDPYLPPRTGIE